MEKVANDQKISSRTFPGTSANRSRLSSGDEDKIPQNLCTSASLDTLVASLTSSARDDLAQTTPLGRKSNSVGFELS